MTSEDILKSWMLSVNGHDLETLLALYDEKAVLIPTFSNRLLNSPKKIRDYFERLCSREELSVALHEKTLIGQPLKNELHTLSGIYCWRFALDGELLSFEARFSYVFDITSPSPIIHHHSSQIPRMI